MGTSDSYIDWTDCELVERVPGKVSGRPSCATHAFSPTPLFRTPSLVPRSKKFTKTIPICPWPTFSGSSRSLIRTVSSGCREGSVRPCQRDVVTTSYMGWPKLRNGEGSEQPKKTALTFL